MLGDRRDSTTRARGRGDSGRIDVRVVLCAVDVSSFGDAEIGLESVLDAGGGVCCCGATAPVARQLKVHLPPDAAIRGLR